MSKIAQAVRESDWPTIAAWLSSNLDVQVDAEQLAKHCNGKTPLTCHGTIPEPSDNIRMWFKNRLAEMNVLRPGKSAGDFVPEMASATLHVFFIALEETEAMLERLRNESAISAAEVRSRIVDSNLASLTAINRTAANVMRDKP